MKSFVKTAAPENQTIPRELLPDFEIARRLHRKHGTSYYFASRLFPHETRLATYALYAFFRVPDEIVDAAAPQSIEDALQVQKQLDDWEKSWLKAYENGTSDDPILRVTTWVFHRYSIPFDYSEAFLQAMRSDLEKTRYANYAELENYMYGSAAVVGLMMSHVIGFSDEIALQHAAQLGYAMQLTNFLRDIDEDFVLRNRIYMPQDELAQFGLSDDDIARRNFSPRFKEFMHFQAARTRQLYQQSDKGIPMLSPAGRLPVRVAGALYGAILGKLEEQKWNPFAGRARTTFGEKLMLLQKSWKDNKISHA